MLDVYIIVPNKRVYFIFRIDIWVPKTNAQLLKRYREVKSTEEYSGSESGAASEHSENETDT